MTKFPVILSLLAVAGLCHADLRSEILASRRKQEKAAKAKDVKAVEAEIKESTTSDFVYVQDGKTQDRKTFIGNFTASVVMMDKVASSSTRILSVKERGSKGSAKLKFTMTGTMKNPDKTIHPIDWTGVFTEEYRKVGGKWKAAKMTAGAQKFLMDGKPVKM